MTGSMRINELTKTEQAHGYVLVCQSYAKSDVKLD